MAQDDPLHNTRFFLEASALSGVPIEVLSVQLVEALSEPYGAELTLAVGDPDADLSTLLGTDCVFEIERPDGASRRVCGIIRAVHEGERAGETGWARIVIVPALWFLSRRRDTRIFQGMSVPEILEEVLGAALDPYGRAIQLELRSTYPTREYCVQYAETDLDFCHRLMEEEGIFYGFEHDGDREKLVLLDDNAACAELPTTHGDGVVLYRPNDLQMMSSEPAHAIHRTHRAHTTSVLVRDWDWTKSGDMTVQHEQRGEDAQGRVRESYEHGAARSLTIHRYGGRAYAEHDASVQAERRHEAHSVDALRVTGIARVVGMTPGLTFELREHPAPGVDGEYLIESVVHENRPAEELMHHEHGPNPDLYRNVFTCIPLGTPFRPPRRTRKPTIPGIQTAVVTGPASEEIHVDTHGRIKVQFHWDRLGASDENSSCWIRVEQAWAGPSWGFWWVPRIGMEVVVQFLDGDPDRPVVTGCVYNGTNATPYALPDEKTKSTIKSESSLGGGGFNEFRFEDLARSEEVFMHAQKDYNEVVEHDHTTLVRHDQRNTVDHDQTQVIGHDQIETVHGNQTITVGGNRTLEIKGNFGETIDGTERRTVKGSVTETFDANEERTIAGNVETTITGSETRTITGDQRETILGSQTRTVTAPSSMNIVGALTQTITGGIASDTPAAHTVTAVGGYTVQTPAAITLTAPGGMLILSPGGVQHIDDNDSWLGQVYSSLGIASFDAYATKTEALGISLGFTKYKLEIGSTTCEKDQVEASTIVAKIRNTAVSLKKRLKLDLSAFREQG